MPPRLSILSRKSRLATLTLLLGGTLAGCGHFNTPTRNKAVSYYGFQGQADFGAVDTAWFLVADAATKTYGELAMLNFAVRQINFEIDFNARESKITTGILHIRGGTSCLSESDLLPILASIASNILQRNEIDAADKASAILEPFCEQHSPAWPSRGSAAPSFPENSIEAENETPSL